VALKGLNVYLGIILRSIGIVCEIHTKYSHGPAFNVT